MCQAAIPTKAFCPDQADQFADKLVDILNGGALSLTLSLGHRTGLFDAMAESGKATSTEIANSAGLNERYVREWLGAMVTGGIIEYCSDQQSYHLPEEHAAWLTRKSAPDNIAVFSQYIPLLGQVEDEILECFQQGGGVPYSKYPRFHKVMAEESGQTVVAALIEHILPLAPELIERLKHGIDVLDIGCGSGKAITLLARHFPNSCFTGYDISQEAIDFATSNAQQQGLNNILFEVADVTNLNETNGYDLITAFDAIHDQKSPAKVLSAINQALRDNGLFLMQDIRSSSHVQNNLDHPIGPFLYTISVMHCMSVSLAQNGDGLGAMWGREKANDMLAKAGFSQVEIKQLDHDIQNDYYFITK